MQYVDSVSRRAWADTVAAAQRHNDPGKFTTFIAYEYTASTPDMGNLHRNVVFKGNGNRIPSAPYSRANSNDPEGLWRWMDRLREDGIESLAIPHNSNGSDGFMFDLKDSFGKPLTKEYAELRMRNEPIVEITQVKGTSDTHPALSTNDEWADFEIMPFKVATQSFSEPKGSYVRDALLEGIKMEEKEGFNPYKFGLIGSSDTHTAASSQEEDNFFSKIGLLDSSAALRGSIPITDPAMLESDQSLEEVDGNKYMNSSSITWGASGLAGVWAEVNTRDSIYDAFRRKESFATSGPRMTIRFFAGYDLDVGKINDKDLIEYLYTNAETMGADLDGIGQQTPSFFGPQLILLIGFVAIMYFLIIRPQNKRLKAQKEMIESLSVGDEVIASGGMVCVITKMNDDFLTVRANDTVLTIQRESVSNVLPKGTIKSL